MRNVFLRRTRDAGAPMPSRQRTTNTPGWVKVAVIIILHLTGNGFGEHMHQAIIAHGRQPL